MSQTPVRVSRSRRLVPVLMLAAVLAAWGVSPGSAYGDVPATMKASEIGQKWDEETLSNGLRVIYAPMATSPTSHVRVLYHVGSRDERNDRQGFAHMFEHMMFRGSAHVAPQEHMKLIGLVGGYSNAFTSFDKTVYVQTLPATYTQMALWLEADRMSSFKVSPQIFFTERLVVAEEWRMRANQPYGTVFEELLPEIYKKHPYQWTPIGKMEHLQAASADELQQFFNRYYVPNNAILVVAGNIDLEKTKQEVHQYYGWIPGAATGGGAAATTEPVAIERSIPQEPPQTEPRRLEVKMRVPLSRVMLCWRMPPEKSVDNDALNLLLSIVGDGRSSRLSRRLVTSDNPLCVSADSMGMALEDGGVMGVMGTVMNGKSSAEVEKILQEEVTKVREEPVTAEELEKVKQQERLNLAMRFETAEKVATELGDEMLTYGNLDRVPTALQRLEALTAADLQRVAKKYLEPNACTTMIVTPGMPATAPAPATSPAGGAAAAQHASTAPATAAKPVRFPADYPTKPPMSGKVPDATFEKGKEVTVDVPGAAAPVRVIVMEDHRTPIVSFTLALRAGGYSEPVGKEGLASMTSSMVRRGPKGKTFDAFNEELESRAITLEVGDAGDNTRVSGFCLREQFPFVMNAAKQILLTPAFDAGEFAKLQSQTLDGLRVSLNTPATIASRQLTQMVYGDTPMGRLTTPKSIEGLTLGDVKKFYNDIYRADGAILVIAGDITVENAQAAAKNLLAGFPAGNLPTAQFTPPAPPEARKIVVVDFPDSKQSSIRVGLPAYTIATDDKFAGSLAGQMLSSGIDSRLGRYVRAEKGYVYGVGAYFRPARKGGAFTGSTETKFSTTADTVEAMFKVFDDLKAGTVPAEELADTKFRVAGQLLMSMETMQDQASQRLEGILNGYPADYYDKYAQRIGQVTAEQLHDVVNKYINENRMNIVVVAPAEKVKEQLGKLGTVTVVPPPLGAE